MSTVQSGAYQEGYAAGLEAAAKVADRLSIPPHQFVATEVARNIAMQIRALKQKSH